LPLQGLFIIVSFYSVRKKDRGEEIIPDKNLPLSKG